MYIVLINAKVILFWVLTIFFLVINIIRNFVDTGLTYSINRYFVSLPIVVKILICVFYILVLVYLFPYRKGNLRK